MADVRSDWPFQISYEDARLPRSLVVLRAETAEGLGKQLVDVQEILDEILSMGNEPAEEATGEVTHPVAPVSPPTATRSAGTANRPIAKLPPEALEAMLKQKRQLCDCNDKWWNNTETKTKPTQPDFKCCKCNLGVWLTPLKSNE